MKLLLFVVFLALVSFAFAVRGDPKVTAAAPELPRKIASAAENPRPQAWWVRRQIEVATILGTDGDRQGTDPWPNCPDPYDSPRYTWRHTVACENRAYAERYGVWDPRAWLDPPGYFRCGLQFEPRWERRYGKLCP